MLDSKIICRGFVPLLAILTLMVFANTGQAAAIDTCTVGANIHCDLNLNGSTTGIANPLTDAVPAGTGIVPDWLVGYTFVLEPGTSYSGVGDNGNVSDVAVFHDGFMQIFTSADANFPTELNNALTLAPIDGTALSLGQIVGAPFFPGAQQFGGIGLLNETANGVSSFVDIFFNGGDGDSITVTENTVVSSVPEPSTLSLMAIGVLGLGMRLRRSRQTAA